MGNSIRKLRVYKFWQQFRERMQDQREGRQLVGQDRFGNRYYQFYSFYGLPIRREIKFKNYIDIEIKDLVYYDWLHNRVYDPPNEQQKKQFYLEQKIRFDKALEWDRKDDMIMLEFRRQREELLERDQALKQIQKQYDEKILLTDLKTRREGLSDGDLVGGEGKDNGDIGGDKYGGDKDKKGNKIAGENKDNIKNQENQINA